MLRTAIPFALSLAFPPVFHTLHFISGCPILSTAMEDELQITLTNDYAFKRLLGSEENKPLLQDFLECILDLTPQQVLGLEFMDKELTKEGVQR